MKTVILKSFKIFFILLIFSPLEASLNEPITIVKSIFNLAKNKNIKENKIHQSKIEEMFNFKIMGQEILGKDFLKYGKKEFTWFHQTIKKIITKTIYPKAPNFFNEVKIEFTNIEKTDTTATVFSIVKSKGEETEVNYGLILIDNNWQVINITIDDESWVENIGEKVKRTIKKKKWAGLKDLLTKRLNELK